MYYTNWFSWVKVDEDGAQTILSMANLEVKGGKLNILMSLQMLSSNCKYDNDGSLLYKKDGNDCISWSSAIESAN
jgi:hypothetical protein